MAQQHNHSPSEVSHSSTQAKPLHDVPFDHYPPLLAAPTCGRRTPKRTRPCLDRHARRPMPLTRELTARSPACCGNGRDHGYRHSFSAGTTPCLKTQSGHLPQGPQTPILTNYRGITTSWPFEAASTCPHDPVSAAPALTYLFNHDSASADRNGDEDVATSSIFTERCRQPRRMFPESRRRRGTSSNGVGSQTDRQKRFFEHSRNMH